jgi:nitroreductase
MSFFELAAGRYSVRKYATTPVNTTTLQQLFTAVAVAPSACNLQPWVFIVIDDEQSRFSFEKVYAREWFVAAPVIIAACVTIPAHGNVVTAKITEKLMSL